MILQNEFPILEYSTEKIAVVNPTMSGEKFPRLCLLTFFGEVFEQFVMDAKAQRIGEYRSEMKEFPCYKTTVDGIDICVVQGAVGSASIAMMVDWLFAEGVEVLLACGGCGVLCDIPVGDVIIPVRALRDDGASYKYLPPSRFIDLDNEPVKVLEATLCSQSMPYVKATTWTTDGFCRETKEMVEYREKNDGCKVVEMECSTMAAVAKFRGKIFGQALYSGDILIGNEVYDDRDWYNNTSARERLFNITLDALVRL